MSISPHMTVFLLVLATSSLSALPLGLSLNLDPCKVADFQTLCRSTIKGQTNVNAATDVAIRELMKRTRHAKEMTEKELKREGGVATCLSNFNSAFDNLDKALQNIKENDGFSLNVNLSAALTDYDTCSDAMKEADGGERNVVYKSAGVLYMMADNCLALSTLVKY